MYVPPHFAETNPSTLHELIERHSFGLLVSQVEGVPFATHLPFLLDREEGPHGTLVGHMARANPQCRELAGQTALAAFSGPHAYISPSWYEAENVVPTWNYAALIDGRDAVLEIVERCVAVYEAALPRPWALDSASTSVDRLLNQIIGFRLRIDRLEGKWKMSQNHPVGRREKVIQALEAQGGEDAVTVAQMVRATLTPGPTSDRLTTPQT